MMCKLRGKWVLFYFIIPNNCIEKSGIGFANVEVDDVVFEEVRLSGRSLRSAPVSYNLNNISLSIYIERKEAYQANLHYPK